MNLGTRVSTTRFTLTKASRDMDARQMGIRERVTNQREITPQGPHLRSLVLQRKADKVFTRSHLNYQYSYWREEDSKGAD